MTPRRSWGMLHLRDGSLKQEFSTSKRAGRIYGSELMQIKVERV